MELVAVILTTLIIIFIAKRLIDYRSFTKKIPPGPTPIPFLGNIHQLSPAKLGDTLHKWKDQYGDIFRFFIGNDLLVVMNKYDLIKEAFVHKGDITSIRPEDVITKEVQKGLGIINASGERWKEHRRFNLQYLRDLGFGRASLEGKVQECCSMLINEIEEKYDGKTTCLDDIITKTVSNVISSIVLGHTFDYDDNTFSDQYAKLNRIFTLMNTLRALPHFLRHLPGDPTKFYEVIRLRDHFEEFLLSLVAHRREDVTANHAGGGIECLVDAHVAKQKMEKDNPSSTFTDLQFIRTILDLFVGGTDTTSVSIRWALLFMSKHPEIQEKVRKEIWSEVGLKMVSNKNRLQLPFTEATYWEVIRMRPVVPLALFHSNAEDMELGGYSIPKGTILVANLSYVFGDKRYWDKPERFNPQRFIDENNQCKLPDCYIPFSTGRRQCLGESLAKTELLILFASLIQHFEVLPPENSTIDDIRLDGEFTIIYKPPAQKLVLRSVIDQYQGSM